MNSTITYAFLLFFLGFIGRSQGAEVSEPEILNSEHSNIHDDIACEKIKLSENTHFIVSYIYNKTLNAWSYTISSSPKSSGKIEIAELMNGIKPIIVKTAENSKNNVSTIILEFNVSDKLNAEFFDYFSGRIKKITGKVEPKSTSFHSELQNYIKSSGIINYTKEIIEDKLNLSVRAILPAHEINFAPEYIGKSWDTLLAVPEFGLNPKPAVVFIIQNDTVEI